MGSKSFKIDHPDGTFVTPTGKTVTVRGGMATVEDASPAQAPQQPQLGDDNYQDNYTGLGGSVRSYADAATGGLPTYANAGLETLYDQLKGRFGGTPSSTGWKESWDQNLGMEQKRARSAASQHKMDVVAGQILSPANLVPGLPIATGASYANALGEDPLVGAAWGTLPVAGQGIAKGAKTISKYGPAIVKGLREGDGPYLRSILKAIEETNAAQPKPLPAMPRRPPSMKAPQEPMPEPVPSEPVVDPRMGARVENLPGNAVKTSVDALPPIPPEQPVMPAAPPRQLRAPKTSVDPIPGTKTAPMPEVSEPANFQMHPEDAAKVDVPDDGMLAKLQEMVARNKPVGTGKPSWPGAETSSMRAVVPEPVAAPVPKGPSRIEFQPPTTAPSLRAQGLEPDKSWLDRLRGRLKELVGQDGNVAKAMENPEARIRARGGD